MVCPSCGKEVTDATGLCPFCGASVAHDNPSECHQPAAVDASEDTFEKPARRSQSAILSLTLGILAFASLPIALALAYLGVLTLTLFVGFIATGISLGLLAVVTGHRAKVSIQGCQGRNGGGDRAIQGMVLGLVGLGLCSITFFFVIWLTLFPHPHGDSISGLGPLRIIDEAAAAYACSYGHGYPPTLESMGPARTRSLHSSPAPNEGAAGFINEELASGLISGYRIKYVAGPTDSSGKIQTFTAHAVPIGPSVSDYSYFTDQSGVFRYQLQSQGEADANSGLLADGGDLRSVDCSDAYNFRHIARQFPVPPERESSK